MTTKVRIRSDGTLPGSSVETEDGQKVLGVFEASWWLGLGPAEVVLKVHGERANLDVLGEVARVEVYRDGDYNALVAAVRALYYAAHWTADRPVDEAGLWEAVRDAAGLEPGTSPTPMRALGPEGETA